jgi:hypothetical protein
VNDSRTTQLRERLHRLADDMTPQLDVVSHVRTARARHRRRRRIRLASFAVATATAVAVVGTTTVVGVLTAGRGEVAAPSQTTAPSEPSAAEEAEPQWMEGDIESLEMWLETRPTEVELRGPTELFGCPGMTARLVDALDISLQQEGGTPGGTEECTWVARTGPAGTISLSMGFLAGAEQATARESLAGSLLEGEDEEDAGSAYRLGECYTTPLPSDRVTAGLRACSLGAREAWAVDVAAADGSGVWVFTAKVPFGLQNVNSPSAMVTLVDLADQTW